jgi:YfiR/HmsC-like
MRGAIGQGLRMILAVLVALASAPARAQSAHKPALLLIKALSYERRLAETKGDSVGIAVLYAADNGASSAEAQNWVRSFQALGALQVHGVPVQAWPVPYDQQRVAEFVRGHGVDVLLACDGTPFAAVAGLAREHRILSASDKPAGISSSLSLGVFVEKDKPRILINMRAAKAEGAVFSAKLLQLAELL